MKLITLPPGFGRFLCSLLCLCITRVHVLSIEWPSIRWSAINIGFCVVLQRGMAWLEARAPLIVNRGLHIPGIPGKFLLVSVLWAFLNADRLEMSFEQLSHGCPRIRPQTLCQPVVIKEVWPVVVFVLWVLCRDCRNELSSHGGQAQL